MGARESHRRTDRPVRKPESTGTRPPIGKSRREVPSDLPMYVVLVGGLLHFGGFVIPETEALGTGLWLLGIVLAPIPGYFDTRQVYGTAQPTRLRSLSKRLGWCLGFAVPIVGPAVVIAYLLRRRELVRGIPTPWWAVILLAAVGSIVAIVGFGLVNSPDEADTTAIESIFIMSFFVTWVLCPFGLYFDAKRLSKYNEWPSYPVAWYPLAWAAGGAVTVLNWFVCPAYLIYRHYGDVVTGDDIGGQFESSLAHAKETFREARRATEKNEYARAVNLAVDAPEQISEAERARPTEAVPTSTGESSDQFQERVVRHAEEWGLRATRIRLSQASEAVWNDEYEQAIEIGEEAKRQLDEWADNRWLDTRDLGNQRTELERSLATWRFERLEREFEGLQSVTEDGDLWDAFTTAEQLVSQLDELTSREVVPPKEEFDIAAFEQRIRDAQKEWLQTETESLLGRGTEAAEDDRYDAATEYAAEAIETLQTALERRDGLLDTDGFGNLRTRATARRAEWELQSMIADARAALAAGEDATAKDQYGEAIEQGENAQTVLLDALEHADEHDLDSSPVEDLLETVGDRYVAWIESRIRSMLPDAEAAADAGRYEEALDVAGNAYATLEDHRTQIPDTVGADQLDRLEGELSALLNSD